MKDIETLSLGELSKSTRGGRPTITLRKRKLDTLTQEEQELLLKKIKGDKDNSKNSHSVYTFHKATNKLVQPTFASWIHFCTLPKQTCTPLGYFVHVFGLQTTYACACAAGLQ